MTEIVLPAPDPFTRSRSWRPDETTSFRSPVRTSTRTKQCHEVDRDDLAGPALSRAAGAAGAVDGADHRRRHQRQRRAPLGRRRRHREHRPRRDDRRGRPVHDHRGSRREPDAARERARLRRDLPGGDHHRGSGGHDEHPALRAGGAAGGGGCDGLCDAAQAGRDGRGRDGLAAEHQGTPGLRRHAGARRAGAGRERADLHRRPRLRRADPDPRHHGGGRGEHAALRGGRLPDHRQRRQRADRVHQPEPAERHPAGGHRVHHGAEGRLRGGDLRVARLERRGHHHHQAGPGELLAAGADHRLHGDAAGRLLHLPAAGGRQRVRHLHAAPRAPARRERTEPGHRHRPVRQADPGCERPRHRLDPGGDAERADQ